MSGGDGRQPFVLSLLARLTTLWLVLKSLIVEEGLLSGSPDEIFVTVYALDALVLIFGVGGLDFVP